MRNKGGFTLVEILIVVLIIGIATGFALLAFGDFGTSRRIVASAKQFSAYLQLLQQKAILEVNTLGVQLSDQGYQTFRFIQPQGWQPLAERLFRRKTFPKEMVFHLQSTLNNHTNKPDIIINPSGDMTEFKLIFGTIKQANIVTLLGRHDGQLIIQLPQS